MAQDLTVHEIRERIGHPVIDGDGHLIEVRAAFARFLADTGRQRLLDDPFAAGLLVPGKERTMFPLPQARRSYHTHKPHFWITPAATRDYAAVTMPGLLHERLPEAGFDFAVIYPTFGLHLSQVPDAETRRGLCRAYNEMVAADFAPYRDRLSPVAVLPLHTPGEGTDELEHATALGLRAFLIPSFVWRTIPAFAQAPEPYRSRLRRMDTFGLDSEHDYDPFWKRAQELNAPLAAHLSGSGLPDHVSPSNSIFSAGQFAATGEALAKSLFLGGVLRRFPRLRVALLEGGVAVGARLFSDLVGRFEKRGPHALASLDVRNIDTAQLEQLAARYAPRLAGVPREQLVPATYADEGGINDFEAAGIQSAKDIRDQFLQLHWGCEGDDPLAGVAFDTRVNPLGTVLPAFVGSDIGHWDVPSFGHPLHEAYEQVSRQILTSAQFRDFTFANAARFYGGGQRDFFAGTAVEDAVAAL